MKIEATQPQYDFLRAPHRFRAYIGGVGSGKTFGGCLASLIASQKAERGAIVAPSYPMLEDVVLPTFKMLAQGGISKLKEAAPQKAVLTNGSTILFRSADKPDRLRGTNLGWFWIDEGALVEEDTWDILLGRLRLDPGRAWLTTTPKGYDWIYERFIDSPSDEHVVIRSTTKENPYLPDDFIESLESEYTARLRKQEMEGRFVEAEGALWSWQYIERQDDPPDMQRIVVGVDPAGGGPDEVGIVVVGKAGGLAYVLDDASMKGSPNAWASAVVSAYRRHEADRVVAEKNFGGDMVKSTLQTADANLPVDVITASRGKQQRAEPVAALYEQGKVFHVGEHKKLEDQMTTWDPEESSDSPDRVDALVWGLTDLMLSDRHASLSYIDESAVFG